MNKAAKKGRGGDSIMGHLAPGEMVVPPQILNKYPKLRSALASAFMENKVDPRRYLVGSKANSINPETGTREFGLFDDFFDDDDWEEVTTKEIIPLPGNGGTMTTPTDPKAKANSHRKKVRKIKNKLFF